MGLKKEYGVNGIPMEVSKKKEYMIRFLDGRSENGPIGIPMEINGQKENTKMTKKKENGFIGILMEVK